MGMFGKPKNPRGVNSRVAAEKNAALTRFLDFLESKHLF
jgi:hypothetical protein